jgi:hypoxanthine phosphoribosyltransferase
VRQLAHNSINIELPDLSSMLQPIRCQAISWNQFDRLVRDVASTIRTSGFQPDVVVAIARGGFVPARILCDYLGVMELVSFRIEHYQGQHAEAQARIRHPLSVAVQGKQVLIVDDLSDTGETFEVAARYLNELGAAAVRTAALHYKRQSKFEPDYYAKRLRKWRWLSYPWARIEDVTELIRGLDPPWGDSKDIAAKLKARHGLRISVRAVDDSLAFMNRNASGQGRAA